MVKKIAILASGNGSNYEAIAENIEAGKIKAEIALVFSDQKTAYVLKRAEKHHHQTASFGLKDFSNKQAYETALLALLKENSVDYVVLAGYMRIIGLKLLESYAQHIINIHPAYLPEFPGAHGIEDAFAAGVDQTGVTIHYVDAGVDTGPIIRQERVPILKTDDLATLATRIHQVEHRLYPAVLAEIIK